VTRANILELDIGPGDGILAVGGQSEVRGQQIAGCRGCQCGARGSGSVIVATARSARALLANLWIQP
jgi:hypothetical protein